jgi:hypothetical protein
MLKKRTKIRKIKPLSNKRGGSKFKKDPKIGRIG